MDFVLKEMMDVAQDVHEERYYKRYILAKLAHEAQAKVISMGREKMLKSKKDETKAITGPSGALPLTTGAFADNKQNEVFDKPITNTMPAAWQEGEDGLVGWLPPAADMDFDEPGGGGNLDDDPFGNRQPPPLEEVKSDSGRRLAPQSSATQKEESELKKAQAQVKSIMDPPEMESFEENGD